MDYLKLSNNQKYHLEDLFNTALYKIMIDMKKIMQVEISLLNVQEYLIKFMLNPKNVYSYELLKVIITEVSFQQLTEEKVSLLQRTVQSNNIIGKLIKNMDDNEQFDYEYLKIKSISDNIKYENNNRIRYFKFIQAMFIDWYNYSIALTYKYKYNTNAVKRQKILRYTRQFDSLQINKNLIKKRNIIQYYLNNNYIQEDRIRTLASLYKTYLKNDEQININFKQPIFKFSDYLTKIDQSTFKNIFGICQQSDIDQIVKVLCEDNITSSDNFRIKIKIAKCVPYTKMIISLNKDFTFMNITDMQWKIIFNIKSDIIFKCDDPNIHFIIVQQQGTNRIYRKLITQIDTQLSIEEYLHQFENDNVYNIIIYDNKLYQSLRKIKIRYLHYQNTNIKKQLILGLGFPQYLQLTSLVAVKIQNILSCENLRTIVSKNNIYEKDEIDLIMNLNDFISQNDKYNQGKMCLLEKLFTKNQLQHVVIDGGSGIVNEKVAIKEKFKYLKCLFIKNLQKAPMLQLNIQVSYPYGLEIFGYVQEDQVTIHGNISGIDQNVKRLQSQLLKRVSCPQ